MICVGEVNKGQFLLTLPFGSDSADIYVLYVTIMFYMYFPF